MRAYSFRSRFRSISLIAAFGVVALTACNADGVMATPDDIPVSVPSLDYSGQFEFDDAGDVAIMRWEISHSLTTIVGGRRSNAQGTASVQGSTAQSWTVSVDIK